MTIGELRDLISELPNHYTACVCLDADGLVLDTEIEAIYTSGERELVTFIPKIAA